MTANTTSTPLSQDPNAAAAEAIYSFAGWLTARPERSGPFSGTDDAGRMAELCAAFCKANGWAVPTDWQGVRWQNPD